MTVFCPGDGIGIRVGLRSQILGVRVSSGAPYKNILPTVGGTLDMLIRMSVFLYGGIAHLVEQVLCKHQVAGSSPVASTKHIEREVNMRF